MTVGELIEVLEGFKPDAEVRVHTTLGTNTKFGVNHPITGVRGCAEMDSNKWFPIITIK